MDKTGKYLLKLTFLSIAVCIFFVAYAGNKYFISTELFALLQQDDEEDEQNDEEEIPETPLQNEEDTLLITDDEIELPDDEEENDLYRIDYPMSPDFGRSARSHPLQLENPSNFETTTEYDSDQNLFRQRNFIGDTEIGQDEYSYDDYLDQEMSDFQRNYFRERSQAHSIVRGASTVPGFDLGSGIIDRIFDGDFIEIHPRLTAELTFAGDFQRVQNPEWSIRQQKQGNFRFDQDIQMDVRANIGNFISFGVNFDTDASFDFDNQIKLEYTGDEDKIIQRIELGNVNMPIRNSLIQSSQSLFGIKSELRFGRLTVSSVFSQQRSETKQITIEDGAQRTEFNISAADYDADRHFFIDQYFVENYNHHMSRVPVILSQVNITRIEVWVTNKRGTVEDTRNIVAFMDIGEKEPYNPFISGRGHTYPDNNANSLYDLLISDNRFRNNNSVSEALSELRVNDFINGIDYQRVENARRLNEREFTFHPSLGYISLNQTLRNDEILAVAFEYTVGGQTYQVGDFSRDLPPDPSQSQVLFLKKLKGTSVRTNLPMWDLMMKNVYFLGTQQIQREDFYFDVVYHDQKSGSYMDFLPEPSEEAVSTQPLIRVLGLDRLNRQQEPNPDGIFDFVEGVTINSRTGRIYFPVLQPFGSDLDKNFNDPNIADKYVYQEIYDSTKFAAQQLTRKDRFFLRGEYRGSSADEFSLEAINVPEGSVRVTAGGTPLQEGVHYTVDYTLGRVRIIDQSILNSGQVINVTTESSNLFNIQQKTLLGSQFDYKISEDFNLGATILYLNERPITTKVGIGDEPVTNAIWGFDGTYRRESGFLTNLVDRIPLIETKAPSEIVLEGEFAHLMPGHSRALGDGGTSYLDDFEASEIPIDLRSPRNWYFASTPQGQPDKFPNADRVNELSYNFERARFSWYMIDPLFYRNNSHTPEHIRNDLEMQSNHYMREVDARNVFRDKQFAEGTPSTLQVLDLAFFPKERGIYNYNYQDMLEDGSMRYPSRMWGGIMRAIEPTDFETANIEYIEFWMMDPFLYNQNSSGGDFYVNIGLISEDILKDGRKSFENGLPRDSEVKNIDTTAWGLVPTSPEINKAFDNDPASRPFQDVGLDGLSTEDERIFFDTVFLQHIANMYGENSIAYQRAFEDPSNDVFRFYRGEHFDQIEANILERYKYYNNPESNSPTSDQWEDNFSTAGRIRPDGEDVSGDFTMNEIEEYFQYRVSLRPNDLVIGQNYITDEIIETVTLKNGETDQVSWYQFKIPVQSYEKRVGNISDFKSIRFMRMFLHGFEDSVVTRLGNLHLVRSDWRRYIPSLATPGPVIPVDTDEITNFDISTVSIEKNASRDPIPYLSPPGIKREIDPSTPYLLEQNEQALSLTVCNLQDGDARAAFKYITADIRHYKMLRMFVHAEGIPLQSLDDGDLWVFIRLGTDQSSNYYEYELPLYPTKFQTSDRDDIWPANNEIILELQEFLNAKMNRDRSGAPLNLPFYSIDSEGKGRVTIMGNPTLNNVRIVMIGVRNPKKENNRIGERVFNDDGSTHCGEIWVNELRVSGYDNNGGWAANARARANLADFGQVTLAGNRKTIGFGSIEQTLQERNRDDIRGYDFTSQFQLGMFFPNKLGVQLPIYYSMSEQIARPMYNPLSPDLLLENTIDDLETARERDSILEFSEDYVARKSINFTNVNIRPTERNRPVRLYHIDNFTTTYAYSEVFRRDIRNEYDRTINHRGILSYNYNFNPDPIRPFPNISRAKYLRPVRDFHFFVLPQTISFQTEVNRRYNERLFRNTSGVISVMPPNYDKDFTMLRQYGLVYNFSRSLKLVYNARANARIDEPPGPIDTEEKKDTVLQNLLSGGRLTDYQHNADVTYQVPFDKIPLTDWINTTLGYQASYNWLTAPPAVESFGHTIQNSNTRSINSQFNIVNLYNKSEYLRTVNQNRSNAERIQRDRERQRRELQRQGGDQDPSDIQEVNERFFNTTDKFARILMSVRNFNINYSETRGTLLPGFNQKPQYIGNNFDMNAPGLPFIFGSQEFILDKAVRNNWLGTDTMLNTLYSTTYTQNLQGQATIEPFRNFRITVDFNKREARNYRSNFRATSPEGNFEELSPWETGNFSMSFYTLPTAFEKPDENFNSETFDRFEENRIVIAQRLMDENPNSNRLDTTNNYPIGYGPASQDVLIPAFLAAYSGQDPDDISLSPFRSIPLPNWRLNYTGLSQMEWVRRFANSVNITHAYRSTYAISNFTSSLDWDENEMPLEGQSLRPEFQINQLSINEQFAPLIGIQINWINKWTSRIEYQKTRNLSLSFTNYQLLEMRNSEFVIGIGYRTTDLEIPFNIGGKRLILENDFNFRFDIRVRNNMTISRVLDQDEVNVTSGMLNYIINPTVEYKVNDNLNIILFFNRDVTNPHISDSYPRAFTRFGFTIRYTLTG